MAIPPAAVAATAGATTSSWRAMGDDWLSRGERLRQEASRTVDSGGSQEAAHSIKEKAGLYVLAANAFKNGGHWGEAADAFTKSAKMQQLMPGNAEKVAINYEDAASCLQRLPHNAAILCLQLAIRSYTEVGMTMTAARRTATVGEIYEKDASKLPVAAAHFEQAADLCREADSGAHASEYSDRAAQLWADSGHFAKAAQLFEKLATEAMQSSVRAIWIGIHDHLLNACLCHLSIAVSDCQQAMQKFAELDKSFSSSSEYRLLLKLVTAANPDKPDTEAFTKAVDKYKKTSLLQPWTEKLLNSIKEALKPKQPELT